MSIVFRGELPDDPDADPERTGGPFAEPIDEHRLELFSVTCALCGAPDAYFKKVGHNRQHVAASCAHCDTWEIIV